MLLRFVELFARFDSISTNGYGEMLNGSSHRDLLHAGESSQLAAALGSQLAAAIGSQGGDSLDS